MYEYTQNFFAKCFIKDNGVADSILSSTVRSYSTYRVRIVPGRAASRLLSLNLANGSGRGKFSQIEEISSPSPPREGVSWEKAHRGARKMPLLRSPTHTHKTPPTPASHPHPISIPLLCLCVCCPPPSDLRIKNGCSPPSLPPPSCFLPPSLTPFSSSSSSCDLLLPFPFYLIGSENCLLPFPAPSTLRC